MTKHYPWVTLAKIEEAAEKVESVCPEWHLGKGVFRGTFTSTKRSAVPRSLEKVDAEAKVLRMG